jgi:hypothetical protein
MTPLVAGIALTGKAPVYENVYMAGLKQKAAGEAAAAKEKNKQLEDIRAAITIPKGGVHNSLVNEVKDLAAETFLNATKAVESDPTRGINKAMEMILEFQSKLNVYQNTSKALEKIETPEYSKNYFSSPQFVQGIGTKNFKEVESDQAIVENARKAGINIQRANGLPVVSTIDYPRFDPAKPFIDWQKATVAKYEAEVGDPTKLGKSLRQEILKRVNEQEAMAYLEGSAADDNEVAAWQNKHNIDITTSEGRKAAAQRFLYTQEKAQTSGPGFNINLGPGSQTTTSPVVSETSLTANTSFNWSPSSRSDNSGEYYVLQFAEGFGNKNLVAGDGRGNPLKFKSSKEAEEYLVNNSKFDYEAIKTLNLDVPSVGITIPAGEKSFTIGEEGSNTGYGEKVESNTFNMKVNRLETVETYTGDKILTVGLFRMEKGDIIPKEVSKYVPSDKTEKRVFVVGEVETSYKTNVGARDKGGTVYVPATKQNISAIISKLPSTEKETRRMLEEINTGKQKLGDGKILGAATKGAERQPKSGFSLLEFDNIA